MADQLTTKKLKKRRENANKEKMASQPLRDEAYRYAIPFRKSTQHSGQGEKRVDQVFDHTAIDSAFRFAGKVQQDLWPAGQENFQIGPGPIVQDKRTRETLDGELAGITKVAQAFFDDGEWDLAFHEMALELSAGTGAMLLNPSDDPERLWEPISVPVDELLLEAGPNNKISGIFWTRKMPFRVLQETWPEGHYGSDFDQIKKDPETEISVHTDTVWDSKKRRWRMIVWCDKQEARIFQSQSRTCPWLTPRYFRVPGETYGRGPVMLAMPTIKTLNTASRLQLQAAAIAMLGIYTAVDDGVFNPDLAPLEPGAFWKVSRNGGALGPSVSRFPDPRLDLSQLVLNEMRMGVKATMMDQSLPPDGAAVRSATEILERVKRLASDHLGAYGRLVKEIVTPAVKRTLEIAFAKGLIASQIPIDQLLIQIRVKSPLAIAREAQRVEQIVNWLQMVLAILTAAGQPQQIDRIAHMTDAMTEIGRLLGVPPEFIVTGEQRKKMDEQAERDAATAAALAAAAGAGQEGQAA